jgi:hypothetical protein
MLNVPLLADATSPANRTAAAPARDPSVAAMIFIFTSVAYVTVPSRI